MDPLAHHSWLCSDPSTAAHFKNGTHRRLKFGVADIIEEALKNTSHEVRIREPDLEMCFDRVERSTGQSQREETDRRADIEIYNASGGAEKKILLDVTMTSPLSTAGGSRNYPKIGCKATAREKEKYRDYKKDFNIDDTSRAHLFFFGVETMGAIGPEAQKFCMLLAKLSGGHISRKITYIYQRLSVLVQGIRTHQVHDTLSNYCSNRGRRVEGEVEAEVEVAEEEREIQKQHIIELRYKLVGHKIWLIELPRCRLPTVR
jgi:hypothetical protein